MLPLLALVSLSKLKNPGIAVLCYHDFQLVAKNDMTNTPKNFEAHMKWLKDHDYQTLSMDELVAIMKGKMPEPRKAVVLSFDDGYEGVYKYAFPVLKQYGFKGVLFLVTSVMGDEAPPMPHLTWPQIVEMDSSNVIRAEVHAQRMHIKLGQHLAEEEAKGLPSTDIEHDLAGAKHDIEQHTHRRVNYIAWPFGDYNTDLIHLAAKQGFYAMVDTEYGVNRPGDSVMKIKRLRLSSANDTLKRFEFKLGQYGLK
ncbi:MAG TPA: polysaccharide deacetylase family protein [Fimbriimonadaceae bacterium]|jgi:peptidoglycan/xylan/chitin deacetylase (PgdA/CDA1 family)